MSPVNGAYDGFMSASARCMRSLAGVLSAAVVAMLLFAPRGARADDAATAGVEVATPLALGETVVYPKTVDNDERRYVGGVTYTIVPASAEEVGRLLEDVSAYTQVLPATKSVRLVGRSGPEFWVELRQGNRLFDSKITLVFRREPDGKTVRFWLDTSRPHAIEDAWGFFRVEPLDDVGTGPRVLLTYGALLDLGPGIVRELFEEKLRRLMLSVPQRVAAYAKAHLREVTLAPVDASTLALLPSEEAAPAATR